MRAAIYNPYLDTLGGGERYTMSFAKVLSDFGYQVDVQWKETGIKKELEVRFGIDLNKINFIPDVRKGDGYDLCFWVSDGSIPMLRSRKNFLHFQVPFHDVGGSSLLNKMKLIRIDKIVCNSEFTKNVIDNEFGVDSVVVYPPVDISKFRPKRKEELVLYVGRFSKLKQNKHQDILIEAFKNFFDSGSRDWKMILAGGTDVGVDGDLSDLKSAAKNYPIKVIEKPDFKTVTDLNGRAMFFWSASGYGENEVSKPENVEHFGITTVEAMSAGCVPIVYSAGGNKEIVKDGVNGLLWETENELIEKTKRCIKDKKYFRKLSLKAVETGKIYSYNNFKSSIEKLL